MWAGDGAQQQERLYKNELDAGVGQATARTCRRNVIVNVTVLRLSRDVVVVPVPSMPSMHSMPSMPSGREGGRAGGREREREGE